MSEKYIWQLKFQQKLPIPNWQITKKRREKGEKFIDPWTNHQWMNHSVVNISDTSISYVTIWYWNVRHFHSMDATKEKAPYHSWLLKFSKQWKHKYVFISIFIPEVFDGISYFQYALQPKASEYKSSCIILLSITPHEVKNLREVNSWQRANLTFQPSFF